MNSPKMRFGLIGAGAIAHTYVRAITESRSAALVGIADVRREAAQALSEQSHCPAFVSYADMCQHTECEAVVIATPPVTHPEICCNLLRNGIHVLCEKPLAISPSEARRMVQVAERSSATLTMASKFRYAADVVKAKSILTSGLLGEIVLFENAFTSRVDMKYRWNSDPAVSGGGVLIDNGTHSVDIMRYFLGPIVEIRVVAGVQLQEIPVEDTVRVFVRRQRGCSAALIYHGASTKNSPTT